MVKPARAQTSYMSHACLEKVLEIREKNSEKIARKEK